MHVHVDFFGRHFEEEQHDGKAGGRNDVAVGLGDGVQQQPIADEALVHEDVDRVAIELLQLRLGVEAGEAQSAGIAGGLVGIVLPRRRLGQAGVRQRRLCGDGQQLGQRLFAEDLVDALGRARHGRRGDDAYGVAESSSKCFSGWASA